MEKKKKNLFLLVKEKPIPFHRSIVVLVHQGIEIEVLKVDCAIKNLMTLAQGSFPMGWRKKNNRIGHETKRIKWIFAW